MVHCTENLAAWLSSLLVVRTRNKMMLVGLYLLFPQQSQGASSIDILRMMKGNWCTNVLFQTAQKTSNQIDIIIRVIVKQNRVHKLLELGMIISNRARTDSPMPRAAARVGELALDGEAMAEGERSRGGGATRRCRRPWRDVRSWKHRRTSSRTPIL